MCQLMPAVARRKIELSCDGSARCNVVGGVAIVENAYDQTMVVEAMGAADIERREPGGLHAFFFIYFGAGGGLGS
jgi:hypothetical protein